MPKVKVTRNFQVTIPEPVRKLLDIKEGDYIDIEATDSRFAVLRRIIPEEELEGSWDREMDVIMEEVKQAWKTWTLDKPA